jgi:HEXXH motif-containing protein
MLSAHTLPRRELDLLASGLGSAATIAMLRTTQISRRLVGLRAALDAAARAGYKEPLPGFELLAHVQRQCPDMAAEALEYPLVGSWVAHCLRLLGGDDLPPRIRGDLAHLSGIAAAAAIRAKIPFRIEVPVREGAAYLPGLGRLRTVREPMVTICGNSLGAEAEGLPLTESPNWQPVHRITAVAEGRQLAVTLDDIDPFRGGPRLPVAIGLGPKAVRAWTLSLREAWDILVRHHPEYASAISAGLVTIVPMAASKPNRGVNATSRESFGAAAMSAASDSVTLAAGILHEFQHCKLNAVLDLIKLHVVDDEQYYAPWREDPRPLTGLLHGAYAYLGVCDFWRVQAALAMSAHPDYAHMEFARWSDRTGRVLDTLLNTNSLTSEGRRFVDCMRNRLRSWPREVPDEPSRLARTASADHRLGWRLRNARPSGATIRALAQAWRAGAPAPCGTAETAYIVNGGIALGASKRLDLLYLRLRQPGQLTGTLCGNGAEPADAELISGNITRAIAGYLEYISREPRSPDGWAGLALALGESVPALLHSPELVCAVYNHLLDQGQTPSPVLLAEWMTLTVPADPYQVNDPVSPSPSR